jgi:hypothetical protein
MRRLLLMLLLSAGCAHAHKLDVRGPDGERSFKIVKGEPGDFAGVTRVCVDGFDADSKFDVKKRILTVLSERAPHLTLDCGRPSAGLLQVTYQSGYSSITHSPPPFLGPRFGVGILRRPAGNGEVQAEAEWMDTYGGTAEELTTYFANDLVAFLADPSKPFTSR